MIHMRATKSLIFKRLPLVVTSASGLTGLHPLHNKRSFSRLADKPPAPANPTRYLVRTRRFTISAMAPSAVGEAYCFNQVSRGQRAMIDLTGSDTKAITLDPIAMGAFDGGLGDQRDSEKTWLAASQFKGKEGEVCALPAAQGGIDRVASACSSCVSASTS